MNSDTKEARYLVVTQERPGLWDILEYCPTETYALIMAARWERLQPEARPHVQIAPAKARKHVPHKEVGV